MYVAEAVVVPHLIVTRACRAKRRRGSPCAGWPRNGLVDFYEEREARKVDALSAADELSLSGLRRFYPSNDDLPRPELLRGWIISDFQREIVLKWLLEHLAKAAITRDLNGVPHARTTVLIEGWRFARQYGLRGGVSPMHTLNEKGEASAESIFHLDSNEIVPEDRYTREEWEPLSKALQFTEPKWYLKLIC
ncbi:hypothetical protein C8J57DRAFT_1491753 [Mycena rebaudengoi]|nr:hypothetical protein C8J57DRAFT_1491753 [Mycena rebaudengoi]